MLLSIAIMLNFSLPLFYLHHYTAVLLVAQLLEVYFVFKSFHLYRGFKTDINSVYLKSHNILSNVFVIFCLLFYRTLFSKIKSFCFYLRFYCLSNFIKHLHVVIKTCNKTFGFIVNHLYLYRYCQITLEDSTKHKPEYASRFCNMNTFLVSLYQLKKRFENGF